MGRNARHTRLLGWSRIQSWLFELGCAHSGYHPDDFNVARTWMPRYPFHRPFVEQQSEVGPPETGESRRSDDREQ